MIIDFSKYDCFVAECYEAEDEFWKEYFEESKIYNDIWI